MNKINAIDNVFNNRVLDLVRNFGIIQNADNFAMTFKIQHDPADMIYIVKGQKLYATIDTGQDTSDMHAYMITDMKHLERLLNLVDENITKQQQEQRFIDQVFNNEYLIFLLSEHVNHHNADIFQVIEGGLSTSHIDLYQSGRGDMSGEIEQAHLLLIGLQQPPREFIMALRLIVEFMNDTTADQHKLSVLESALQLEYSKYKGAGS